jgi:hypothetical protein
MNLINKLERSMNEELLAAVESASPEMIVAAFSAAMEAAYVSHPREGYAAALASIAAARQAAAEAQAKAEAAALAAAEAAKAAEVASAPVVA